MSYQACKLAVLAQDLIQQTKKIIAYDIFITSLLKILDNCYLNLDSIKCIRKVTLILIYYNYLLLIYVLQILMGVVT